MRWKTKFMPVHLHTREKPLITFNWLMLVPSYPLLFPEREWRWIQLIMPALTMDYRRDDGHFPVSASCVSVSNPDSLSRSETRADPGIRSWKKHSSEWSWCQKAIGGIYFTKKWWRAQTLQPGLEFDNFKPRLESGIFKCISWLNGSVFEGDDRGFLKEGFKTFQMAPMSPLNSSNFFLSSHL
jgi:hypothetical protein